VNRLALSLALATFASSLSACRGAEAVRFSLRPAMLVDTDRRPVYVACEPSPKPGEPAHVRCAPEPYESPLIWDGADNLAFRPLSDAMAVKTSAEAVDVNSYDEVPDSAWFTNRLGRRPLEPGELRAAGCTPSQRLQPEAAADRAWVVDQGKLEGSSGGFRVRVPGQGKYLVKAEAKGDHPERSTAASVMGMAVLHAVGYFTPCEQVVYLSRRVLELTPGLRSKANFAPEKSFDEATLQRLLGDTPKRGGRSRMSASSWLPGFGIGPARYVGTRDDDPNDVIPHQDRREIRAMRLVAAWLDRWDAREENTFDTWMAVDPRRGPDSSPGHVVHYQLDTSEAFGGEWGDESWAPFSKRIGAAYLLDWGDLAGDFFTLGLRTRPWDTVRREPGREIFGFMDVAHFDAEGWKAEYSNPAFNRMTERDGAWMARILARFTPAMIREVVDVGDFTEPGNAAYLVTVLEGRLDRILRRYLTRLSPLADVVVDGDTMCGVDLAALRGLRRPEELRYAAVTSRGDALAVDRRAEGRVCVHVPHRRYLPAGRTDYLRVTLRTSAAPGPLVAHLYDLGPARAFVLAGLERPE
jgi:hypothetical protein